jgi:DNA polymerase III subunit beta
MKATCIKKHLKEAIGLCEKVTGKNLSLPVLSNVLIFDEGKSLKFVATNLEIGIEIEVPAKIEKKGKLAVPADIINNFLANFSGDENITLESQNNNLLISTPNSSTLIKGQPTEDFPVLPKIKSENPVLIPADDFVFGLKSVWYACSVSNIKPEISSVFLSSDKKIPLSFVATDSFRLAEKKIDYSFPELHSLLIPTRSVSEILRIFDNREGKIKLIFDKNQISIELDNIRFISRLTEGVFPDYQQIIPKNFIAEVIVDKNIFINSLRAAGIFSGKLNELNIEIGSDKKNFSISATSVDVGEHFNKIPASVSGEELKMVFNHRYIFDCLSSISSSKIALRFVGEGKPLLLTGADDNTFQYLVMPMNTL